MATERLLRRVLIAMLVMSAIGCRRGRSAVELKANAMPRLLSQTGVFADLSSLVPSDDFIPYDINVPFWSDGAVKKRWIWLPARTSIHFERDADWKFPGGTTLIKHFERDGHRIETRILVCDDDGVIHGASYRWRDDDSDADLVSEPQPTSSWYFPGEQDCRTCHTSQTGGVLGVRTSQMNRGNQLLEWQKRGLFDREISDVKSFPKLARADDLTRSLSDRARSYLDANCANCHRPGGVAGNFDARFETPLAKQNLVNGNVLINLGIDHARTISPNDTWRSIVVVRIETNDRTKMPPLAHEQVDRAGAALLRDWIASLPGKEVLAPPTIEPAGGEFRGSIRVSIHHPRAGATIRYTIDGALPIASSPAFIGSIELHEPTTLRARAFKDGMVTSIATQETFITSRN